ncbi:MAG: tetratricopeptide repeat protein [Verrucomicrobiota bacterium]|nr:tetratricopeptide repeat protein [Verrucomicrobiota bacterium]
MSVSPAKKNHPAASRLVLAEIGIVFSLMLTGCDRMVTPRSSQTVKDADAKATDGDFSHAIALYETALDGTPKSADIHYRLALLYDDKMSDPLNALHHFKRYLALAPTGTHANDAKNFMKRDELALVTNLSGDSVVSRTEASRLKNENLTLRKELEDQRARAKTAIPEKASRVAKPKKTAASTSKKAVKPLHKRHPTP